MAQSWSSPIYNEHVSVITDRTIYVTGETVLFTAVLSTSVERPVEEISKALYCELVTPDGERVAAGKYLIDKNICANGLPIPADILTGYYYLRAYTRFMRNGGPAAYSYTMLSVINPGKADVLSQKSTIGILADSIPDISPQKESASPFQINLEKTSFSTREQVKIEIQDVSALVSRNTVLSVSIILAVSGSVRIPGEVITANKESHTQYIPETRSISLSGRVINKSSGEALPLTRINLSIIGEKNFMAILTDSSGAFYFSLPSLTGNRDVFLCAENSPGTVPSILVDNDYCTAEYSIPALPFRLSAAERQAAYSMAINNQVHTLFLEDSIQTLANTTILAESPFYGKPSDILVIDKYVQLPTLEEYFNELPGVVRIRKRLGKPYFKFSDSQSEMSIYDPLVMIDWVAVNDMEKVMAISPLSVSRIELVNAPYVKGDITYGGIVSIISRRNDFAGIDLPSSGVFINYSFLPTDAYGDIPQEFNLLTPDCRNTLYWNPRLNLDKDGKSVLIIRTPDTPGTYGIFLHSMTKQGEVSTSSRNFEVR
jgi:hypothetical protein